MFNGRVSLEFEYEDIGCNLLLIFLARLKKIELKEFLLMEEVH